MLCVIFWPLLSTKTQLFINSSKTCTAENTTLSLGQWKFHFWWFNTSSRAFCCHFRFWVSDWWCNLRHEQFCWKCPDLHCRFHNANIDSKRKMHFLLHFPERVQKQGHLSSDKQQTAWWADQPNFRCCVCCKICQ